MIAQATVAGRRGCFLCIENAEKRLLTHYIMKIVLKNKLIRKQCLLWQDVSQLSYNLILKLQQ